MATADVVVIGGGVAGLTAALSAAQGGARVQVLAKGHAGLYWGTGGLEVAATLGAPTPGEALGRLADLPGHPYSFLVGDVGPALEWLRGVLAAQGLAYEGGLDSPLTRIPTSIGGTRPAAIVPAAQAPATRPWASGETLVVCGVAGYKDFWPDAIAMSLARAHIWGGDSASRPERVVAATADLPDMSDRHNLNAPILARRFDDARWRAAAFDRIAAAVAQAASAAGAGGSLRVAVPAIFGYEDHTAAWEELGKKLPGEPFEVPIVPPSIPGMRLYRALRVALLAAGGRILLGEVISDVERDQGRITSVATTAAAREFRVRTESVILATGGIAGGGIVAEGGLLREVVLDLPVEAPAPDDWLAADPFDPAGHPLEAAGVRTDADLRPLDTAGAGVPGNVRVGGALLAGQHALRETCRAGVSFTSGRRAGLAAVAGSAAGAVASGGVRS
jgi:glycerol-3-phosphate dehydrogenase subunit B